MFDVLELIQLIGQQADSPSVHSFLGANRLPLRPKVKRGEADTYLSDHQNGFSLLFQDAEYFGQQRGVTLPSDAPVFVAAFFYGVDDDYTEFGGALPNGLKFNSGREDANRLMGRSVLFDPNFNTEAWDIGNGIRLFLDYADDRKSIKVAQLTLTPEAK